MENNTIVNLLQEMLRLPKKSNDIDQKLQFLMEREFMKSLVTKRNSTLVNNQTKSMAQIR